jgi:hypothetical protein
MLNSPVFALFHRRLRQETRSGVGHVFRLVWLGVTLLAIFGTSREAGRMAAPGLVLHSALLTVNFVLICLLGTGIFAKAITEEKEDKTLGLLRMTSLGSVSILLGKATGAMLCMILLLAAQLPFALLSVTLGGIGWEQVVAGYAALIGFVLVQANLGLFWSVQCPTGRRAALMTVISLAALFLTPWFLYGAMGSHNPAVVQLVAEKIQAAFLAFSPFHRAYVTTQGWDGQILAPTVLINVAMALLFFLLAWWRFAAAPWERHKSRTRIREWLGAIRRHVEKGRRSWRHSVMWQSFHFVGGGRTAFMLRCLGVLCYLGYLRWLAVTWEHVAYLDFTPRRAGGFMLGTSLIALSIEAAWSLGRLFGIERQEGTWSSLYGTRLSLGQIVRQKVAGWLLALSPWILMFVVGSVLSGDLKSFFTRDWHDDEFWLGFGITLLSLLLIVYLSLFPRRAPIMMTAAIMFIGHISMIIMLDITRMGNEEMVVLMVDYGLILWLVFAIRYRLIAMATE